VIPQTVIQLCTFYALRFPAASCACCGAGPGSLSPCCVAHHSSLRVDLAGAIVLAFRY
jgi:hypothetical protein